MNTNENILHLSLIKGVGPGAIQALISKGISVKELYHYSFSDFLAFGIPHAVAETVYHGLKDKKQLDNELALIERHAINWVSVCDESYPALLKHIHSPPVILYWRGTLPSNEMIAVVGSRATNRYGEEAIHKLVPDLIAHDFAIVSGGALGADSLAHQAALDCCGKTIAVLGSGLLRPYPRSNRRLFENIINSGGAVMSSFSLTTEPFAGHFPARNRIISGLSKGVIVIQAAEKSGARITAQFALEQGRDVFAVPGSIEDPLSAGCHALIKDGAKLVGCSSDILEEYGFASNKSNVKKQSSVTTAKAMKLQSDMQEKIVKACFQAQSIDTLAQLLDIDLDSVQKELFILQMEGHLEQDFMGMWKSR